MRTDPDFMSYTAADTMIFRALGQTRINSAFSFDRARPFSFRQDEKKMGVQTHEKPPFRVVFHINVSISVPGRRTRSGRRTA